MPLRKIIVTMKPGVKNSLDFDSRSLVDFALKTGRTYLERKVFPALDFDSHIFELHTWPLLANFQLWLFKRAIAALNLPIKAVHYENIFTIPKPVKAQTQSTATINDVLTDMGFNDSNGPWNDPAFDGGAGGGVQLIFGIIGTGVDLTGNETFPFQDGVIGDTSKPIREIAKYDLMGGPPYHPHETWVSTLMLGSPDGSGHWKGGCYRAKFYSSQVLDGNGSGTTLSVVDGFNWMISQNPLPHIINMSLGGTPDPTIKQAVDQGIAKGCLVYAASGNSGKYPPYCDGSVGSPADADTVISCGAASIGIQNDNGQRQVASFTSREPRTGGSTTTLPYYGIAAGVNIQPSQGAPVNSGTSFASPLRATSGGAVAHKILRTKPSLSPVDRAVLTRTIVQANCTTMGYKDPPPAGQGPITGHCVEGDGYESTSKAYTAVTGTPNPPPPTPPPTGRIGLPTSSNVVTFTVTATPNPNPNPTDPRESDNLVLSIDQTSYAPGSTIHANIVLKFASDSTPMGGRSIQLILNPGTKTVGSGTTDTAGNVAIMFLAPNVSTPTTYTLTAEFPGDQIQTTPVNEPKLNSAACGPVTVTYSMPPISPLPAQSSGNANETPLPPNPGYSNPVMRISSEAGNYPFGSVAPITISGAYPDGTPIVGKPFILLMASYDNPNQWNSFVKMSDSTGKAVFGMIPFAQPPGHTEPPAPSATVNFVGQYLGDGTAQNIR